MKVQQFDIVFDNPQGVFDAGGTVSGHVRVNFEKPLKMRSLKVFFYGEGRTGWKKGREHRNTCKGKECYLDHHLTLKEAGPLDGGSVVHPAGNHIYPFAFALQSSIPSSFEGKVGYVRYFCRATINRPWKFDSHVKKIFTVIHHLDMNMYPDENIAISLQKSKDVDVCCWFDGSFEVTVTLNKTGFVPGEPIVYDVQMNNKSHSSIKKMRVDLIQNVNYHANALSGDHEAACHKTEESFNLYKDKVYVRPNASGTVNSSTLVPSLAPSRLDGCRLINIQYRVAVRVVCRKSVMVLSQDILIGTKPYGVPVFLPQSPATQPSAPAEAAVAPAGAFVGPAESSPLLDLSSVQLPAYDDAPPPSYAESVFGKANVCDENDDEHTSGDRSWAPAYPYYDWTLRPHRGDVTDAPTLARLNSQPLPLDDGDEGL